VAYQYDALDRLLEEFITESDGVTTRKIDYTYDLVGNRVTRVDTMGGEADYTYDANDRLLSETTGGVVTNYTYDANGNTLSKHTSAVDQALYEWDAQNRMVGATVTDSSGTHAIVYAYDADGIRASSTVDGDVTKYLIDTVQPYAQVLEEYTPGGVIKVSYVYGNDLISQNRGGEKSFYGVDGLGSTRVLTNAGGVVTDRYVYDAFGRTIGQTGSTENSYLFAGEQRDANVGLDYLRARWMSSSTGRFFGMDPADGDSERPISLNKYLYGASNPVMNVDPSGMDSSLVVAIPSLLNQLFTEPVVHIGATVARARQAARKKEFIVDFRTPTIALNTEESQAAHPYWTMLNYEPFGASIRRYEAVSKVRPPGPGYSRDEYPYASTLQGGYDSDVYVVPQRENSVQGGLLKSFYRGQGQYTAQGPVSIGDSFVVDVTL
jgi:RHS repeat-associated protein